LITASHWADPAQQILRNAGLDLVFMNEPADEASLIKAFSERPYVASVLRGTRPFTERVLAAAPSLRVIAKNGAGVDGVDIAAATARGVRVMVAAAANADAVAEHALAMMLSMVRQLTPLDAQLRRGQWPASTFMGHDFRGSTVGIVGFGSIGRRTAQLCAALGAQVLVYRRASSTPSEFETETDFARFLSRLDILSLHCPLNDATRGLIGAAELACLKPSALLINTARGPVVDEAALIDALRHDRLRGAGLDTFDVEPLPADHPFTQLPNVLLSPHVAGVTHQAATQVAMITADNIVSTLAGRAPAPGRLINPEVLT
jgi:D-3-phosphoglycerate dehydrogenase